MKSLVAIGPSLVSSSIQYGINNISASFSTQIQLKTELEKANLEISLKEHEINLAQNVYQEIIKVANQELKKMELKLNQEKKILDYRLKTLEEIESSGSNEQYIEMLIRVGYSSLKG